MITRSIHYFGTYDQLNIPCLGGVDVLCQRLSQLVEAYASGDCSKPNDKGVKHLTAETSVSNVAPTTLRSYAHRRAKEEHEMEHLRQKASGATGGGGAAASEGSDEPQFRRRAKARAKAGVAGARSTALNVPPAAGG